MIVAVEGARLIEKLQKDILVDVFGLRSGSGLAESHAVYRIAP